MTDRVSIIVLYILFFGYSCAEVLYRKVSPKEKENGYVCIDQDNQFSGIMPFFVNRIVS